MNIGALIEVFRMVELSEETRAKIIVKLGRAFNDTVGMNLTEPIVYELVKILEPENVIFEDPWFLKASGHEELAK